MITFFDRLTRDYKLQTNLVKCIAFLGVTTDLIPEMSILLNPYKTRLHPQTEIIEVPETVRQDFAMLCDKVDVPSDQIFITTYNRFFASFFGGKIVNSLLGLKCVLCMPAVFFSTPEQRRSRGYSYLTLPVINWNSSKGQLIEYFTIPNKFELQYLMAVHLFKYKYNTWLVSYLFVNSVYLMAIYTAFMICKRFNQFSLLFFVPILFGYFCRIGAHYLTDNAVQRLSDNYLIKNFPDLVPYAQYRLANDLLCFKTINIDNPRLTFYERIFNEEFRLFSQPKIQQLRKYYYSSSST